MSGTGGAAAAAAATPGTGAAADFLNDDASLYGGDLSSLDFDFNSFLTGVDDFGAFANGTGSGNGGGGVGAGVGG